jgi:hypothetical protein
VTPKIFFYVRRHEKRRAIPKEREKYNIWIKDKSMDAEDAT